jgi:hypothetical protein
MVSRRKRRTRKRRPPEFGFFGDLLDADPVATLDLHGDTAAQAEPRVRDFILTHSRISKGQVVRILTGKGRGSPRGPVLPSVVRRTLEGDLGRFVDEFDRDLDEAGFVVRLK